jgi:acyl-CoA thioester hydrolase
MVSFSHFHRVRYWECDPMGVVHHSHYLKYFEDARTEALREIGITYHEIESSGVFMPVIESFVKYRKPAYYDDLLEVKVLIPEEPGYRISISYEVHRREGKKEDELVATGKVDLCFFDRAGERLTRTPEALTAALHRVRKTT